MDYKIKKVLTKEELKMTFDFYKMIFQGVSDVNNPEYSLEKWQERMKENNDLMLYASSDNEVIAMVFGRVNNMTNMTIGPVAVHENYRGHGLAKKMVFLLEEEAMKKGLKTMDLGAVDTAENFYKKLGFNASLLIQSQDHSVEQLLTLKTEHSIEFTNIYDNKVAQLCLSLKESDNELRKKYETTFPGSYTMILFKKKLG